MIEQNKYKIPSIYFLIFFLFRALFLVTFMHQSILKVF